VQKSNQLSVEIRINENTIAKELINVNKVSYRISLYYQYVT